MGARETLDKLNAKLIRNENDAAVRYYSEDAVMVTPEGTFKGREEIKKWFAENSDAFSDFKLTMKNQVDSEEKAVDEWEMNMKHTGNMSIPGFGESIPATNKNVTMKGVDIIITGDDGLIRSHHVYYDQKDFTDQLGIEAK